MTQRWMRWIAWGAAVVIGALADRVVLVGDTVAAPGFRWTLWWWVLPAAAAAVGALGVLRPLIAPWVTLPVVAVAAVVTWGVGESTAPLSVSLYLLAVGTSTLAARSARSLADGLTVAVGAAAVVLSMVGTVRLYSPWPAVIGSGLVPWGVAVAVAVAFGQLERQRDQAVVLARTEERLALARELHDVVGHHLTGIVLVAQGARLVASQDGSDQTLLGDIEAAALEALDATRRVVSSLRVAQPADSTDLEAELDGILADVEAAGLAVQRHTCAVPAALVPTVIALTREACTNVRRHAAGARSVALRVADDDGDLVWELVDDGLATESAGGRGWDASSGFGLVGMEERVVALGGSFSAGPVVGGGWRVAARLPAGVNR